MTDINSLDAETRCLALVGKFLQKWAAMEGAMHLAMQRALELDAFQAAILASNIRLWDKINILRTLVSRLPFDADKIKRFDHVLVAIGEASHKRNMIAHNAFAPSPEGEGVSFSVTKAKGKLAFADIVWGVAEFEKEYAEIERFTAGVAEIVHAIDEKEVLNKMRDAIRAHPWSLYSTGGLYGPGAQNCPTPIFLALHSSDAHPTTPKTDDQTP
jgi:hypothetical protein